MMGGAFLLAVLLAAAPTAQEQELQRSTTLPVDRDLGEQLANYDLALTEGRFERAASLLQRLLEADPALLVSSADADLLIGAAAVAHARLAQAPPELLLVRREQLSARAAEALVIARLPPDPQRLVEVARLYDGLEQAREARLALAELWADRGQPALAALWDPRGHAAPTDPLPPFGELAVAARLPTLRSVNDPTLPLLDAERLTPSWNFLFRQAPPERLATIVRHRVAIGDGLVYVTNGIELSALEAGNGVPRWRYAGDPQWELIHYSEVLDLEEAVSAHSLSVPVIAEGIVLCVLQETERLGRSDSYSRIDIRRFLPARRLHAFDAATGRRLWSAATPWDGEAVKEPRGIACGAPAVSGGRVFLPVYDAVGTIDFSLQCLDLRTGRPLWKRFLASGQLETNLFGNVLRELATPPPVAELDRVQACSHLGSFHALDAATGEVLWTRTYPRMRVASTETGRIADRPQLLASNLGASDGVHIVWAPADSDRVSICDARSGALLAQWPAVDARYRHVAHLLGLAPDAVWATGSRVFALPLDGVSEPRSTRSAAEARGELVLGRAGVMVQGEILVPDGMRTVERYDANTLAYRGRALDFGGEYLDSGALQAAPGLLFVVRASGVSAWASLASLLAALRDPAISLEQLERILPIASSLELDGDPTLARGFAAAAAEQAGRPHLSAERERLLELAARCWISAGDLNEAEPLLAEWLADPELARTLEACGLLLDEPMVSTGDEQLIEHARHALAASGATTLRLRSRQEAPVPAVLARARALRAIERGDMDEARVAFAQVLQLTDDGKLAVRGIPLIAWADAVLELVLEKPAQQRAYEEDARRALENQALDERMLRAFARTAAGQERLARELTRSGWRREDRLERERWRHDWGDPERDWPGLENWLPESPTLPPLPHALDFGRRQAATGGLLAWQSTPSALLRLYLPVMQQRRVVAISIGARSVAEEFAYPLGNLRVGEALISSGAFATPEGCAVLLPDLLLHFGADGNLRRMEPPGRYLEYDPLLPLGDGHAAAVFEGREGFLRITVFDGVTGTIHLQEELPGSTGRRVELRREGRWLHVLEQDAERAYRLDLHFRTPPLAYGLPIPMSGADVRSAVAMDGGIAFLANRRNAAGYAVRAIPGEEPWVQVFEGTELRSANSGPGLAWITLPLNAEAARVEPRILHWLAPGARASWKRELGGAEVRLPELELPHPFDPIGSDAIVFTSDPDGATRVSAHRLGAAAPAWTLRLPELAYASLHARQPQARRAADGWVLCLLQTPLPSSRARMHLLLVGDEGRVHARRILDAGEGAVSQFWAEPVTGGVLVRNGDHYLLMGEFE